MLIMMTFIIKASARQDNADTVRYRSYYKEQSTELEPELAVLAVLN